MTGAVPLMAQHLKGLFITARPRGRLPVLPSGAALPQRCPRLSLHPAGTACGCCHCHTQQVKPVWSRQRREPLKASLGGLCSEGAGIMAAPLSAPRRSRCVATPMGTGPPLRPNTKYSFSSIYRHFKQEFIAGGGFA